MIIDVRIRKVIEELLKNKVITMSWGITEIRIHKEEISFHVSGLQYHGAITIRPHTEKNEYLCGFGSIKSIRVPIKTLVYALDKHIERIPQYEKHLRAYLTWQILSPFPTTDEQ